MTDRPPYDRVTSIHGVPRSGTSWLGEIFNSHPDVAYRFQPLFSYAFKDALDGSSSAEDVTRFLAAVYETDDDFVLQRGAARLGPGPVFEKSTHAGHLVLKMVRYHHLIPLLLDAVPDLLVIGVVRHPCAVVNSFLSTSTEWEQGWDPAAEWRYAPSKNAGRPEEFYGFDAWRRVARMLLDEAAGRPERVRVVRYETLVGAPERTVGELFEFAGLVEAPQTASFLAASRRGDLRHDHGVYKDPAVVDRWRDELDPAIAEAIVAECAGTDVEIFL